MRRWGWLVTVVAMLAPLSAYSTPQSSSQAASATVRASSAVAPGAAVKSPLRHGLRIFTDYSDHAVVETIDMESGRLVSRIVEGTGAGEDEHGEHGDHAEAAGGTRAPSAAQRCSNSGGYEEFHAGETLPWRISEPIHVNPSGAPSYKVSDWRNQVLQGKYVWEQMRNQCGLFDTIIWDMPTSYDTHIAVGPQCYNPDDENVVGFANLGGWAADGLVLARTCVWFNGGFIYESDMAINNHPDAKWANGAYAGHWDLQSVAAHEFGHMLGLGHAETNATRETAAAVMHTIVYQQDTRNRTLSRGDIDGAISLYPRLYDMEVVTAKLDNPAGPDSKLEPSRTYTVNVEVLNRGYRAWKVGDATSLHIGTYPAGRCSSYVGADWRSCTVPSLIDADMTDSGGGPENDTSVIAQGETARLSFQIPVTWEREGTFSFEGFRVQGIPVSNPGTFSVPVDVGTYKVAITSKTDPGTLGKMLRGTTGYASVAVRNAGTAPWILTGGSRLQIVTDPAGRAGRYRGSDWPTPTIASRIDTPTDIVHPGQVATLQFSFYAPFDTIAIGQSRTVSERFDLEIAGRPVSRQNTKTTITFEIW